MQSSPKRSREGLSPRRNTKAPNETSKLRDVKVLDSERDHQYGSVMSGRIYDGGQLVLIRPEAISCHPDLINSAQPSSEIPVTHHFWGRFGNNFDFNSVEQSDSRGEKSELLAVSPDGHILLVLDDSSAQTRRCENFGRERLFAPSNAQVTSVLIVAPGLYLAGTSRGDVFRFRLQGKVLLDEQLHAPPTNWLTAIREKSKQLLMPVLQVALGGGTGGGAAGGGSNGVDVASLSPVSKLLTVPKSPYLLACGDCTTLWAHWDKGTNEQALLWTLDVKALVKSDLTQIKLAWESSNRTRERVTDRYSFNMKTKELGRLEIVDFVLLSDESSYSSWGTLVLLVHLSPEDQISSNLWLYTLDLARTQDSVAPARPGITHRAFLASGVSGMDGLPPHHYPRLYSLPPSWRIYCSWVGAHERVVFGQLDVRALAALSDAVLPSEPLEGQGGQAEDAAVLTHPPGILTLESDLAYQIVAAMATSACTGYGSRDRSRQKVDGLVVLARSPVDVVGGGGELKTAIPPLGAMALPWAPVGYGAARPHSSSSKKKALRTGHGKELLDLLLSLRPGMGGIVTVGSVRDAIAGISPQEAFDACSEASKQIVDLYDSELEDGASQRTGKNSVLQDLEHRCYGHTKLVEELGGAGILSDEAILREVQQQHEFVSAAVALVRKIEDLNSSARAKFQRDRRSHEEGLGAGDNRGSVINLVNMIEEALTEYVSKEFEEQQKRGLHNHDLVFARVSRLPRVLLKLAKALDLKKQQRLLQAGAAFGAFWEVSCLLLASLDAARTAAAELAQLTQVPPSLRDLSLAALHDDTREAALLLLKGLSTAAMSANEDGINWPQIVGRKLFQLSYLVLSSYKCEATKTAPVGPTAAEQFSTVHMPLDWQRRQREAKIACCDSLLALGQYDHAFDLACLFHIPERLLPAAKHFSESNLERSDQVKDLIYKLIEQEGAVQVRALAPAVATWPPGQESETQVGVRSIAEHAFMSIEAHMPSFVALQLDLRLAAPAIFKAYVKRREPDHTPNIRHHFAWMSAVCERREGLSRGTLTDDTEAELLAAISKGALDASNASSKIGSSRCFAAISKLAAYASGGAEGSSISSSSSSSSSSADSMKHAELGLLRSELQRAALGAADTDNLLHEFQLARRLIDSARSKIASDPDAAQDLLRDCLQLLSLVEECSSRSTPLGLGLGDRKDGLEALEAVWVAALSLCPELRDMKKEARYLSDDVIGDLKRKSHVGKLLDFYFKMCVGGSLVRRLEPQSAPKGHAGREKVVYWDTVFDKAHLPLTEEGSKRLRTLIERLAIADSQR